MLATVGFEEVQCVLLVTYCDDPSLYSAYPNICKVESGAMDGPSCDRKKEVSVPDPTTFKVVTALNPPYAAVIFTFPGATPAASPGLVCPVVCTVATAEFDVAHAAKLVTGFVEPSL